MMFGEAYDDDDDDKCTIAPDETGYPVTVTIVPVGTMDLLTRE